MIWREQKESFWDDENTWYFVSGGDYRNMYNSQKFIQLYTMRMFMHKLYPTFKTWAEYKKIS